MRRKLRLALLVVLTSITALWAVLFARSFLTYHHLQFGGSRGMMLLGSHSGCVGFIWTNGPYEPHWEYESGPAFLLPSTMFDDMGFQCDQENHSSGQFTRYFTVPTWVPMFVFGLWPAMVGFKAHRRPRRQVRGFDVTPVG